MTQESSNPTPQGSEPAPPAHGIVPPLVSRTIRRILAEAAFVAFLGAFVFGITAEMHLLNPVGFIAAVVIWIGGTPTLEILRLLQTRK